jgi:DNA polymerase III subunit gamma/tau
MSYQVLARKWRPNSFAGLVGQEHVVSAISNALDNNRLHHAYLFTGTRGVGKTTIARIFSKSLNCEVGLSATPCGKCSTCVEIEQGNFIDMLEIDAASRTKVEDTRELLDNVQYRPSRGRYKVYLIDEVHMLSKHSFNALLKTLEEPPPHVKFLLATTDPQKLPVTILSRCLQFNLKALSRSQISQQLAYIMQQEQLDSETEALSQLARAAQGSMRDALSLTDQAIAQGNGVVSLSIVTDMLGLMDKNVVLKLLNSVLQKDSNEMMQLVENMSVQAADFGQVLAELMSLLHQVALTQFVPEACKLETIAARAIFQMAKGVAPEHIQLLYQIALNGKKDLPYAADLRSGLEMTLLRMLAFCPDNIVLSAGEINSLGAKAVVSETGITQAPVATSLKKIESDTQDISEPAQNPDDESAQQVKSSFSKVELSEPESQHYPEHDYDLDDEQQNLADSAYEQELFAQQQGILQQAEDYGHRLNSQSTTHSIASVADSSPQEPATDSNYQSSLSATETMLALRKKLQQSQAAMEEKAQTGKKPEKTEVPNLASIRQPIATEANHTALQAQPITQAKEELEPLVAESLSIADEEDASVEMDNSLMPPWADENMLLDSEAQVDEVAVVESPILENINITDVSGTFDTHGHLALDDLGEVNLDIPVFLEDKQKVISAIQVDKWSELINAMQITALTKQLALHSSFVRVGHTVKLTLLESKAHLDTFSARQQLSEALSKVLQSDIALEIELGHPINTPFAIQQKINLLRLEFAHQVINSDQNIALMQQLFAAKVDSNSIVAI